MTSAKDVLRRIEQTYSSCASYRDKGEVRQVYRLRAPSHQSTTRKPFTTLFVRPDRFRFEFREFDEGESESDQFVVWTEGGRVRTWWSVAPTEDYGSVGTALSAASGISGGSAVNIPGMLSFVDRGIGRGLLDQPWNANLECVEQIDGRVCYHLARHYSDGSRVVDLWVDRESSVVRRLREQVRFGVGEMQRAFERAKRASTAAEEALSALDPPVAQAFDSVTTTDYCAELNVQIEATEFGFDPPEDRRPRPDRG